MIKFTGRKRYKIHKPWFSPAVMILQLEKIECGISHMYNECGRVEIDDLPDRTFWVNATLEDVTSGDFDLQ